MDGNKDESERCIEIAEQKIKQGDYTSALKFLRKADQLYPSTVAKGEIVLINLVYLTCDPNC